MKNSEPKSFIQGESLNWTRVCENYAPASGWTLNYYVRGAGKGFDAEGSADGVFSVSSQATAQMQVGNYNWQLFASKSGENKLIDSGTITVKAGLAAIGVEQTFDGRSEAKIILDNIRAMIAKKATLDQSEYAIGNRQLKRIPITELIALEKHYAMIVSRENQAERIRKGGSFFKKVHIRMKG